MVQIKGYDGSLPIYLADEITEDVGGKKPCKLHVAIATLSETDKVYGKDNRIIVVDKHFLRFSRKNKLALLWYYNALVLWEEEGSDWHTQKGPEMGAKADVVAVYGKFRFTRAFRKLESDERKAIRKGTSGLHRQYKKGERVNKQREKLFGEDFIDPQERSAVDLVAYYMEKENREIHIDKYKGAPLDSGNVIDPECRMFYEDGYQTPDLAKIYGDEVDENDENDAATAVDPAPAQA